MSKRVVLAYGEGIPGLGFGGCRCACCEEARNRFFHDRRWIPACSCSDYEPTERCDCRFCTDIVAYLLQETSP